MNTESGEIGGDPATKMEDSGEMGEPGDLYGDFLEQQKQKLLSELGSRGFDWEFWEPVTITTCSICKNISDHDTDFCPFKALDSQVRDIPRKRYFPPILSDAERSAADYMRQRGMNLVRITNQLKYDNEAKLEQLFSKFGRVTHVYVPDEREGEGGSSFVDFSNRTSALTSIRKLNGSAFEELTLTVEWATLRPERQDGFSS